MICFEGSAYAAVILGQVARPHCGSCRGQRQFKGQLLQIHPWLVLEWCTPKQALLQSAAAKKASPDLLESLDLRGF